MKQYSLKFIFLIFLLTLAMTITQAKILVVHDIEEETAVKIIEGLKSEIKDEFFLLALSAGPEKIKQNKTDYVIAFGGDSYKACKDNLSDSKIFFAMISNPLNLGLSANTIGGITFEPDPDFFFNSLKKIFPKATKIGVAYVPDSSQKMIDKYISASGKYNLTIVTEKVESAAKIPIALKTLPDKCDLIWGGPDDSVFTQANMQIFASTSFSKKIPIVFNSKTNAEKGGTISIVSDYNNIGILLGKMINEYKLNKSVSEKIKFPLKTITVINMKMVGQLQLALPSEVLQPGPSTIIIFK
ncbi:MAG: ABC transporter substrate binding protein [bacterium]|nr:ABC transporter substrate binding protein [bacterium]